MRVVCGVYLLVGWGCMSCIFGESFDVIKSKSNSTRKVYQDALDQRESDTRRFDRMQKGHFLSILEKEKFIAILSKANEEREEYVGGLEGEVERLGEDKQKLMERISEMEKELQEVKKREEVNLGIIERVNAQLRGCTRLCEAYKDNEEMLKQQNESQVLELQAYKATLEAIKFCNSGGFVLGAYALRVDSRRKFFSSETKTILRNDQTFLRMSSQLYELSVDEAVDRGLSELEELRKIVPVQE